ncbi:lipase class 3 [Nitzschia inconspicua]|uniref:Lipase class 3 n=1 Tax=Nitzschia inconspicua TaxID=303405 RepID=A0A9K3KG84_9STRA|nr:lipase class 3 [Nitzschia inconspicua]
MPCYIIALSLLLILPWKTQSYVPPRGAPRHNNNDRNLFITAIHQRYSQSVPSGSERRFDSLSERSAIDKKVSLQEQQQQQEQQHGSSSLILGDDNIQDLVVAASLSYLPLDTSSMKTSPYYDEQRLVPLQQINDSISQTGATIFRVVKETETIVVVACRGTTNWKNFGTNLQFQLVEARQELLWRRRNDDNIDDNTDVISAATTNSPPDQEPFLVHSGFQKASIELWNVLQPALQQILDSYNGASKTVPRLVFTGHSLGAATALLCAVQYSLSSSGQRNNNSNDPKIGVSSIITFGGPRLVNNALAQHWQQHCFQQSCDDDGNGIPLIINLIHSKDPILQQNQPLWDALGYAVVGREMLCASDQPKTFHNETTLDKSVVAFNFWDHCMYLGTFVGPRLFLLLQQQGN